MKQIFLRSFLPLILLLPVLIINVFAVSAQGQAVTGAWKLQDGAVSHVLAVEDGYFTYTAFNIESKEFINSIGGTLKSVNQDFVTTIEFSSNRPEMVGRTNTSHFSISGKTLTVDYNGRPQKLENIDDGTGTLTGTWRITGRVQEGKESTMTPGARKTLKILTGTRFQWFAINPETKEFSGTGGGTYTFQGGKYTETIEFFSRDPSRVGISLSFDDRIENKAWHHTGRSSKGDPIHEIWTRHPARQD